MPIIPDYARFEFDNLIKTLPYRMTLCLCKKSIICEFFTIDLRQVDPFLLYTRSITGRKFFRPRVNEKKPFVINIDSLNQMIIDRLCLSSPSFYINIKFERGRNPNDYKPQYGRFIFIFLF